MIKTLTVKTPFQIGIQRRNDKDVDVWAQIGDTIKVRVKDAEHYYILKLNNTLIGSRWMRQNWINGHCK